MKTKPYIFNKFVRDIQQKENLVLFQHEKNIHLCYNKCALVKNKLEWYVLMFKKSKEILKTSKHYYDGPKQTTKAIQGQT